MTINRLKVWIIQQGVWQMPKASMPLAAGYLKAMVERDPNLRREVDSRIFNFGGAEPIASMAQQLFKESIPDMLAFSVLGWNYRSFGILADTFKQLNPTGIVVFGGTHVANQAKRVFREWPAVDIIVNGEGEQVFVELITTTLLDDNTLFLDQISGISYKNKDDGAIVTTCDRPRIQDLDEIESPILSGAIPLVDAGGEFLYDVALLETNRGCPYRCAFCYWGGAIGQKIRTFSRDRLHAEVEWLAKHKAPSLFLCDANFGMLESDEKFVEDVIRIREQYGYPQALESSWAKNKSKRFFSIVRRMKEANLRSSFTLSLQTLNPVALDLMNRRNMRLNEWEELVRWLHEMEMDCFAELIWGAPGETVEDFLEGYDRLAVHTNRIATYPLMLLPNTAYSDHRDKYGFITVRGEQDDFEYILAHSTLSIEDGAKMQRFVLWARILAEHGFFRHIWKALLHATGMTQSEVIMSAANFVESSTDKVADLFRVPSARMAQTSFFQKVLRELYCNDSFHKLLDQWWQEKILLTSVPNLRDFLEDVYQYDYLTRPIYDPGGVPQISGIERVKIATETFYHRPRILLKYDVPSILKRVDSIKDAENLEVNGNGVVVDLYFRVGFANYIDTQELLPYFVGMEKNKLFQGMEERL